MPPLSSDFVMHKHIHQCPSISINAHRYTWSQTLVIISGAYHTWDEHKHSPIVTPQHPIISGDNSHINQVRECAIRALCASHTILIIGMDGEKKKEREMKTRMLFPNIIPSSHSALFYAQYTHISTVSDTTRDNDAMLVSLLRGCMVSDGYTLCIEEYMPNRL